MISQPSIPVPLVIDFPFPPWATRKEEVAEDGDDVLRVCSGSFVAAWLVARRRSPVSRPASASPIGGGASGR